MQGKWLKKKMAVTGMVIGLQEFGVAIGCLRAFWAVQRWTEVRQLLQHTRPQAVSRLHPRYTQQLPF